MRPLISIKICLHKHGQTEFDARHANIRYCLLDRILCFNCYLILFLPLPHNLKRKTGRDKALPRVCTFNTTNTHIYAFSAVSLALQYSQFMKGYQQVTIQMKIVTSREMQRLLCIHFLLFFRSFTLSFCM